jgi:hypothetical protein
MTAVIDNLLTRCQNAFPLINSKTRHRAGLSLNISNFLVKFLYTESGVGDAKVAHFANKTPLRPADHCRREVDSTVNEVIRRFKVC